MGIKSGTDFLPKALELSGQIVDLRYYKNGIVLPLLPLVLPKNNCSSNRRRTGSQQQQQQDQEQEPDQDESNKHRGKRSKRRSRRRPLRIGIDISSWIYRAGHAFGDRLMADERHLTNYGRANIALDKHNQNQVVAVAAQAQQQAVQAQQQVEQQQVQVQEQGNNNSNNDAAKQQQQQQQQPFHTRAKPFQPARSHTSVTGPTPFRGRLFSR